MHSRKRTRGRRKSPASRPSWLTPTTKATRRSPTKSGSGSIRLNDALRIDADRACGGKGSAALHDCMEKKKAALARQGISEPMLTIQAQASACRTRRRRGSRGHDCCVPGRRSRHRRTKSRCRHGEPGEADAESKAQQAERDALGLDERDHGLFLGVHHERVQEDPAQPAPASDDRTVILNHKDALKKALGGNEDGRAFGAAILAAVSLPQPSGRLPCTPMA